MKYSITARLKVTRSHSDAAGSLDYECFIVCLCVLTATRVDPLTTLVHRGHLEGGKPHIWDSIWESFVPSVQTRKSHTNNRPQSMEQ